MFHEIELGVDRNISKKYLAFKIPSKAEIKNILFSDLKLLPSNIKNQEINHGILGCRFEKVDEVQYFLDIDTLFTKSLESK